MSETTLKCLNRYVLLAISIIPAPARTQETFCGKHIYDYYILIMSLSQGKKLRTGQIRLKLPTAEILPKQVIAILKTKSKSPRNVNFTKMLNTICIQLICSYTYIYIYVYCYQTSLNAFTTEGIASLKLTIFCPLDFQNMTLADVETKIELSYGTGLQQVQKLWRHLPSKKFEI